MIDKENTIFLKDRLETVERLLSDGIVLINIKGTVIYSNEAFYRLSGFSEEEIIGRHFTNIPTIKNIKDMPNYMKLITEIIRGREIKDYIFKWRHKNGEIRYGSANIARIKISDNERCIMAVLKDVTEKVVMRKEIEKEREQFLTLLDGIDESISVTDPQNYRILFQNKENKKIFGDKKGSLCHEIFYGLERPCEFCSNAIIFSDNGKEGHFNKEKHHSSLNRWFDHYSKSIKWTDRKLVRLGMAKDITDRKLAELSLKQSEKRFRELVENLPSAVTEMDIKGNITYLNRAALEMTGFTYEDLKKGIDVNDLIGKQEIEKIKGNIEKILNGQETESNIYEAKRKDGSKYFASVYSSPIKDEFGNIKGIRTLGIDITERKELEQKLKYLSFHDSLTGLYNRAYFDEELKRLDTQRSLPVSIIMGDLNSLKLMNDAFGHDFGDVVLKRIAKVLKRCCRADDILARWGGDEFSIILPNTDSRQANNLINRINRQCNKEKVGDFPISISLGSATKKAIDQNIDVIIQEAENVMYRKKLNEKKSITSSIISTLESTLKLKSYETEEHGKRLQKLSKIIAEKMELSSANFDKLLLLCKLHDLGKILVPEKILKKKEKLTRHEKDIIKKHPETGYSICESSSTLSHISEEILSHHEWWDGSGYPRGLKGENIPLVARILSVLDAYDVMINDRPYKDKITKEEAIIELKRQAGKQFDPEIIRVFISMI